MTIKISEHAKALPLYQHARAEGEAIGLRLGLEAVTAEIAKQEYRAEVAHKANPLSRGGSHHELTIASLHEVAKVLAARFRA